MIKKKSKFEIFKILCLIAYILCVIVLIVESCMDGKTSAGQSNAVGGGIAEIINGISGDKTIAVKPTNITIDNKDENQIGYVGDSFYLEITTLPLDATYQQVIYSTSDSSIASISDDGKVTFNKEGDVTITVTNEKYTEITDSINIKVNNINIASIDAEVLNATKENDIYTLYVDDGNEYQIVSKFTPENATFKDVNFTIKDNTYLTVDEKGKISNLKDSKGVITTITVSCMCGEITKEINVVVDIKNKVELLDIELIASDYEIYVTESMKLTVKFYPTDATYKGYKITSSNTSIIKVNQSTIKGLKKGTATITIKSNDYDIEKSIEITVSEQPDITYFNATLAHTMVEKESETIKISDISPNAYALKSSLKFESSDSSIATVNENGKVTANKAGNVTITVTTKNGKYSVTLTLIVEKYISPEVENHILGFDTTFETCIIQTDENNEINLTDHYTINEDEWIYDNSGLKTGDKTVKYYLDDESSNVINGSILTINTPGEITLTMQHIGSETSINITLVALNPFEIIDSNNNEITNININSKEEYQFTISQSNTEQQFTITIYDENNNIIKDDPIIMINDDGTYTIKSIYNEGNYNVVITPQCDGILYNDFSKSISLNISHLLLKQIDFDIYDNEDNMLQLENNTLKLYINELYSFVNVINSNATKYDLTYLTSDKKIAYVNEYNKLVIKKIGEVDITLNDNVTSLEKTVHLIIYNKILIDKDSPIILKGADASYDETTNVYSITNGYSSKLKVNFLTESTYKEVTYSSSNEKVLSVGKDGTLTPHSVGEATITIICNDNMQEKIEINVNIKIKQQPLIKDLSSFFYKVRKALGHFGAFLVLGIFSTLTYMLFFTKKKWLFSVPLNFILGFALAFLTEYIQTFVPGRSGVWSDVVIDFSGFLCSAITFTIGIFIVYIIKYIQNRKLKKDVM